MSHTSPSATKLTWILKIWLSSKSIFSRKSHSINAYSMFLTKTCFETALLCCQNAFLRGDAKGSAGTETAVPNLNQMSSGSMSFLYFVGQMKILVEFSSYYFCFNLLIYEK